MTQEEFIQNVSDMLKKETWTRTTINSYTENNLKELESLLAQAKTLGCIEELKKICSEKLLQTKESIIALYFASFINLQTGEINNTALDDLIQIFDNNHKDAVIKYLCQKILDIDETNKTALRRLYGIYRDDKEENKRWEVAERLVKADMEEADIAKHLAEHYESQKNVDLCVTYYKKALLRYVSIRNINGMKAVWTKLVSLVPKELDFFLMVENRIAKGIAQETSIVLLQELYNCYKDAKDFDVAIELAKLILQMNPKDEWARKEITACYRERYKEHSHLEEYITQSNLTSSFRNVFEAINDFEKHIAFDQKHFVFHRSWGVGIIQDVTGDTITINFGKKSGKKQMSLKIAVSALQPLSKEHIWVLKATKSKEALAKKMKEDIAWGLKTVIRSFSNSCSYKQIKAELVPAILSPSDWTSWSNKAKKILSEDSTFGVNPDNSVEFVVRDRQISKDEKLSGEFKAQKKFFDRLDVFMRYAQDEETDKQSELFSDMFSYFTSYLKSINTVNEYVVASYLVVLRILKQFSHLAVQPGFTFAQLFSGIEDISSMYDLLKDTKNTHLKEDFIEAMKLLPNWQDVYANLFSCVCSQKLLDTLELEGETKKLVELVSNSFENYKENRKAVLYFFRHCKDKAWFKEADISEEKQLITLVNIISHCYREVNNHVDTTENRKIISEAEDLLFKNNTLVDYIIDKDKETIKRMYTLVNDVKDISPDGKGNLRKRILEKDPDFKFQETEEKVESPKGLMVTSSMLAQKKEQLEHITKEEIPSNAKEIGEAMARGDLKENAEYKAAKEHQAYLNTTVRKLQEELGRAVVFDPTTVTTAYVSFGTVVELFDKKAKKTQEYTILGPWESDPNKNIISYMSPFGNAILNAKEGDELDFSINRNNFSFTVKKIKVAKI